MVYLVLTCWCCRGVPSRVFSDQAASETPWIQPYLRGLGQRRQAVWRRPEGQDLRGDSPRSRTRRAGPPASWPSDDRGGGGGGGGGGGRGGLDMRPVRLLVHTYILQYNTFIHTCIHTYIHTYIHTIHHMHAYIRRRPRSHARPRNGHIARPRNGHTHDRRTVTRTTAPRSQALPRNGHTHDRARTVTRTTAQRYKHDRGTDTRTTLQAAIADLAPIGARSAIYVSAVRDGSAALVTAVRGRTAGHVTAVRDGSAALVTAVRRPVTIGSALLAPGSQKRRPYR